MKITFESELMTNHKHADVLGPDSKFLAVQTKEGHSLLFSIGTDHCFYLTQETPADLHGWRRTDLSSDLAKDFDNPRNVKVIAKTFDVAQNAGTGNIDLALVVTVGGEDFLYLSQNNPDTDDFWSRKITWNKIAYDNTDHPQQKNPVLKIADVFLSESGSGAFIVVDVFADPNSPLELGFRYFIDPQKKVSAGRAWNPAPLSGSFNALKISTVVGRAAGEDVDGHYTLGEIGDKKVLNYSALYNTLSEDPFEPRPDVVDLVVPPMASAIAAAPNEDGTTNLFVAADKALYFFRSDEQADGGAGEKIVENDIFAGVDTLFADVTKTEVFVWGLNQLGDIFYLKCAKGKEKTAREWSFPVPILQTVEQITPYVNRQSGHSVIFAHLDGKKLIQLSQDPSSAIWQERNILLPSTKVDDVVEYKSFSTHIQVLDDDNLPFGKPVKLSVTSHSPVGIYINNVYHKLSENVATELETEATGSLTIIQETQSLSAMCYKLVHRDTQQSLEINPMLKMVDKIASDIKKHNNDLGKIEVSDEQGNKTTLISSDTPADRKNAITPALQKLVEVSKNLPADGSKKAVSNLNFAASQFVPTPDTVWGVSFADAGWSFHDGTAAMNHFGLRLNAADNTISMVNQNISLGNIWDSIELAAEDFWNWLKGIWHKVEQFFVKLVGEVYHFFVQIGETLYRFIVNTIHAIVNAVEFIFNKIKTFFEQLIKWLGFIFSWKDILRTHDVLKNLFTRYAADCIANIDVQKSKIAGLFDQLEEKIKEWAHLPTINQTPSGITASASPIPGQHTPQSNWGVYHTQHNAVNSESDYKSPHPTNESGILGILDKILALLEKEKDTFCDAFKQLKDLIENIKKLSITDIVKRLIGIFSEVLVDTVKNITLTVFDIFKEVLSGMLEALEAPFDIPVISWLYQKITGNALSFLDLMCLVVAVPTTIIYKLVKEETPFPDDSTTKALTGAENLAAIKALCNTKAATPALTDALNPALNNVGSPRFTSTYDKLYFSGNVMAAFGSLALCIINPFKLKFPESGPLAALGGIFYLPYASPSLIGSLGDFEEPRPAWFWCDVMDIEIAREACLKSLCDISLAWQKPKPGPPIINAGVQDNGFMDEFIKTWAVISPWSELAINAVWQIPTTGYICYEKNRNIIGWTEFVGGTCFDAGGCLAPAIANDPEPDSLIVLMAFSTVCNLAYAATSIMLAVEKPV